MFFRHLPADATRGAARYYGALLGLMYHFASGLGGSASVNESTPNVSRIQESQFAWKSFNPPCPWWWIFTRRGVAPARFFHPCWMNLPGR